MTASLSSGVIPIGEPAELGPAAVVAIARHDAVPALHDSLTERIAARREQVRALLAAGGSVYGVNTGMGALSEQRLSEGDQARHQEALMLARSVGGAPWLGPDETRAVLAVRLRTFLNNDSGVSADLCRQLADMLAGRILPAVPRTSTGVAGEIVALAHLARPISGHGQVLDASGDVIAAGPALRAAGLDPLPLGPKEGVALIEGTPVTTALAILCAHDARTVLRQGLRVLATELAVTDASRDTLDPALARADDVLAEITAELRRLAGSVHRPRSLQPPVSFRVSAQILAHLDRAVSALDAAIARALDGLTDSPAFVDGGEAGQDGSGRFVSTAGFYGYDLAAHLQLVTVALMGAAEAGATRLHRMMDPRVSGVNAQLSAEPGPHTGLSPVHKRAVGVTHRLRRLAVPATIGTVESSAGQEDIQSFSLEAAEACRNTIAGLTDVIACELLALHQAGLLGARLPTDAAPDLHAMLDAAARLLPTTPHDRPFGLDLTDLHRALADHQLAQ